MGNVKELIAALRYCSDNEKQEGCDECPYLHNGLCHTMLSDAARLIEDMLADVEDMRAEIKDLRWELNEAYNH